MKDKAFASRVMQQANLGVAKICFTFQLKFQCKRTQMIATFSLFKVVRLSTFATMLNKRSNLCNKPEFLNVITARGVPDTQTLCLRLTYGWHRSFVLFEFYECTCNFYHHSFSLRPHGSYLFWKVRIETCYGSLSQHNDSRNHNTYECDREYVLTKHYCGIKLV